METYSEQLLSLVEAEGIVRARYLNAHGIPQTYLSRLVEQGLLQRVARGLYRLPGAAVTEHHSLVKAQLRVPHGVICLLSALAFHRLTTQLPFEVWLAIENKLEATLFVPATSKPKSALLDFRGLTPYMGVKQRSHSPSSPTRAAETMCQPS